MKRSIVCIVLEIISIMFLISGYALFFGSDKNQGNTILSKMYENFQSYEILLLNKFPILQSNPELFGMGFLFFGSILMAGTVFYLKNSE